MVDNEDIKEFGHMGFIAMVARIRELESTIHNQIGINEKLQEINSKLLRELKELKTKLEGVNYNPLPTDN